MRKREKEVFSEEIVDTSEKMEISEILSNLIGDELSAWFNAWMGSQLCRGKAQHSISDVLYEIAEEEKEHAEELISWANSNNILIDSNINSLISRAISQPQRTYADITTSSIVEIVIESERKAIQNYKKFKPEVEKDFPDLAQRFMEISLDEQKHLEEFIDFASEVGVNSDVEKGTSVDVDLENFSDKHPTYEGILEALEKISGEVSKMRILDGKLLWNKDVIVKYSKAITEIIESEQFKKIEGDEEELLFELSILTDLVEHFDSIEEVENDNIEKEVIKIKKLKRSTICCKDLIANIILDNRGVEVEMESFSKRIKKIKTMS